MGYAIEKAVKSKAKLRLAIFGPSGSGKTFTALRLAAGIGGPVGLIDTERRTARKYSDRFEFDLVELENHTIDGDYIPVMRMFAEKKYPVLIIDSLSHAWKQLLEEVDALAQAKFRGNTWSAWSEGTPQQRKMVEAILSYPGHIICTMRSDTEWSQEKDERSGKLKPVKVGLKPQQGKGIEYEFDMLMEINVDHIATVTKDRTGKFQDKILKKPGEEVGKELIAWLNEGVVIEPKPAVRPAPTVIHPDAASPNHQVLSQMKEADIPNDTHSGDTRSGDTHPGDAQEPTDATWDQVAKEAAAATAKAVEEKASPFEIRQVAEIAKNNGFTMAQVQIYMRKELGVAESRLLTKSQAAQLIGWLSRKGK